MIRFPDLARMFTAARVRRWHTNPVLSDTSDHLDGHQGRVARIILALHPDPSAELLACALTHDDGEWAIGDWATPIKSRLKTTAPRLLEIIERDEREGRIEVWGERVVRWERALTDDDREWLVFADKLDALMWCAFHNPVLFGKAEWPAARAWVHGRAADLGIGEQVHRYLKGAGQ